MALSLFPAMQSLRLMGLTQNYIRPNIKALADGWAGPIQGNPDMTTDYDLMSPEEFMAEYESAMRKSRDGDSLPSIVLLDSILASIGRKLMARYRATIGMLPELAQMCSRIERDSGKILPTADLAKIARIKTLTDVYMLADDLPAGESTLKSLLYDAAIVMGCDPEVASLLIKESGPTIERYPWPDESRAAHMASESRPPAFVCAVIENRITGRREYWLQLSLSYVGHPEPESACYMFANNRLSEARLSDRILSYSAMALIDGLAQARRVRFISMSETRPPDLGPLATESLVKITLPVKA